jgi:hypothetical protein
MANTYTLISSSTVGSGGASSILFSSIPSTYTDLCIKMAIRTTRAEIVDDIVAKFNGSTANQSGRILYAKPILSFTTTNVGFATGSNNTASTFGNSECYFPNYASSNFKSWSADMVDENNSGSAYALGLMAGLWSSTSAITSIELYAPSQTFVQYSTAYLYGISNA